MAFLGSPPQFWTSVSPRVAIGVLRRYQVVRVGQMENIPGDPGALQNVSAIIERLADRYYADAEFRRQAESDASAYARSIGIPLQDGVKLKILADTASVMHFAMPAEGEDELGDEQLENVVGGGASTVGSASSIGCTFSCPASTLSSLGSVSSNA